MPWPITFQVIVNSQQELAILRALVAGGIVGEQGKIADCDSQISNSQSQISANKARKAQSQATASALEHIQEQFPLS